MPKMGNGKMLAEKLRKASREKMKKSIKKTRAKVKKRLKNAKTK